MIHAWKWRDHSTIVFNKQWIAMDIKLINFCEWRSHELMLTKWMINELSNATFSRRRLHMFLAQASPTWIHWRERTSQNKQEFTSERDLAEPWRRCAPKARRCVLGPAQVRAYPTQVRGHAGCSSFFLFAAPILSYLSPNFLFLEIDSFFLAWGRGIDREGGWSLFSWELHSSLNASFPRLCASLI